MDSACRTLQLCEIKSCIIKSDLICCLSVMDTDISQISMTSSIKVNHLDLFVLKVTYSGAFVEEGHQALASRLIILHVIWRFCAGNQTCMQFKIIKYIITCKYIKNYSSTEEPQVSFFSSLNAGMSRVRPGSPIVALSHYYQISRIHIHICSIWKSKHFWYKWYIT